jgi:hypothetical protein
MGHRCVGFKARRRARFRASVTSAFYSISPYVFDALCARTIELRRWPLASLARAARAYEPLVKSMRWAHTSAIIGN